jgi:hypothetical protein
MWKFENCLKAGKNKKIEKQLPKVLKAHVYG